MKGKIAIVSGGRHSLLTAIQINEAYQQGRADALSEKTDDVLKSNFNTEMFKACLDSANQCGYEQGKADTFADCILENGEYCWQECCETEHCKECRWLGNGDTIWFEQMQKGAEE